MKTYTIEYSLIYTMTQEVEAENEEAAIDAVEDNAGAGIEHDVRVTGFTVIDEYGEEEEDE